MSKRGRETATDMLRSLAVVLAVVVPLWFFGQASPSDSRRIRPVNPAAALAAFVQDTHGPVPSATPAGWVPNVAVEGAGRVRVGYVLGEHYAEFAGGSGPGFLDDASGKATDSGSVDVQGVVWRDYRSADGQESLVRTVGMVTVLVGGVRENATRAELEALAAMVR